MGMTGVESSFIIEYSLLEQGQIVSKSEACRFQADVYEVLVRLARDNVAIRRVLSVQTMIEHEL